MEKAVYRDDETVYVKQLRKGYAAIPKATYDAAKPPVSFIDLPTKEEFERLGRGVSFGGA